MTGRRSRQPGSWADGDWSLPPGDDDDGPAPPSGGVESPSRTDPVARAASVAFGGPAGRRLATATGLWRALPVLVLLAGVLIGGAAVERAHCRTHGWTTPDQFWHACYSDIPVLFESGSLGDDSRPGLRETAGPDGLGQPPVLSAAMWVVSAFVPQGDDGPREFFDLSAVVLYLVLAGGVAATVLVAGRRQRPWDAAHLALSPVLLTAGLISYGLLAVTLLVVAILAWTRERPVWAGVWLGLAVASAPVLSLVALALVAAGAFVRRGQPVAATLGTALATWWLLRVLLLPGLFGGLASAWHRWTGSAPGYGSTWLIPQLLESSAPDANPGSAAGRVLLQIFGWLFHAHALDPGAASVLALLTLIVLVVPVVWFGLGGGLSERERPRRLPLGMATPSGLTGVQLLAPLALALLAAGLLTVKTLPVQASLLLLPLIALAGLRWRDHLIWAITELVYFVAVWLYIANDSDPRRGLPDRFYLILLVARLAGIAWIGVQGVLTARQRVLQAQAESWADFPGPGADGYALARPVDDGELRDVPGQTYSPPVTERP